MAGVKNTISFGESFKKFNILPLTNVFSLLLPSFTAGDMEKHQIQICVTHAQVINMTLLHPRKDYMLQE